VVRIAPIQVWQRLTGWGLVILILVETRMWVINHGQGGLIPYALLIPTFSIPVSAVKGGVRVVRGRIVKC